MVRMRWIRKMGRGKGVLAALVALVTAGAVVAVVGRGPNITGSRSSGARSDQPTDREGTAPSNPDAVAPGMGAQPAGTSVSDTKAGMASPPVTVGQVGAPTTGPRVVRTADVTVRVASGSFSRAFDGITAAASAEGGYVSGSTTSTTGSEGDGRNKRPRSGDLTVRVPADRFDALRRTLAGLGTVEQEQIRGDDVAAQIVDYDARLRSLRAEEDALRILVGRATAVGEVLQVQSQLFDVRQQVESLQAQRDQLDQQASLATIHVSLLEPGTAFEPPRQPNGLAHALHRAAAGSTAVVGGTIVVLGWLAPLALMALLVWGVVRLRRRGTTRVVPDPSLT